MAIIMAWVRGPCLGLNGKKPRPLCDYYIGLGSILLYNNFNLPGLRPLASPCNGLRQITYVAIIAPWHRSPL
jgi:hypothetical protein